MAETVQQKAHQHTLLKKVYPRIVSLADLINQIRSLSNSDIAPEGDLVREDDPAPYAALLRTSLAVLGPSAPHYRGGSSRTVHSSSQAEVLSYAVEQHFSSNTTDKNVLCFGFRKRRASAHAGPGLPSADSCYPNTTAKALREAPWEVLLSRIGDSLMLHLLLHASIFTPLPNGCYLQVCGRPTHDVVYARAYVAARIPRQNPPALAKRQLLEPLEPQLSPRTQCGGDSPISISPACSAEEVSSRHQDCAPAGGRGPDQQARPSAIATGGVRGAQESAQLRLSEPRDSARPCEPPESGACLGQCGLVGGNQRQQLQSAHCARQTLEGVSEERLIWGDTTAGGAAVCRKGPRPSSWQRRKAAKQRAAREAEPHLGGLPASESEQAEARVLFYGGTQNSSGQVRRAPHQGLPRPAQNFNPAPPPPSGSGKRAGGRAPKGWVRPSDVLLPRQSAFYSATSSKRPGLPASHILRKVQGKPKAARILYAAVFRTGLVPRRTTRRSYQQARLPAQLPLPPRSIPRRHQHLLSLMRQIILRSRRCPFGLLLKRHCPLPSAATPAATPEVYEGQKPAAVPQGDGALWSDPMIAHGPCKDVSSGASLPLGGNTSADPASVPAGSQDARLVAGHPPCSGSLSETLAPQGHSTQHSGPNEDAPLRAASPQQLSLKSQRGPPLTQAPFSPNKQRSWQQPRLSTANAASGAPKSAPLSIASQLRVPSQEDQRGGRPPLTQCSPPSSLAGCVPMLCEPNHGPNLSGPHNSASVDPQRSESDTIGEQPAAKRARLGPSESPLGSPGAARIAAGQQEGKNCAQLGQNVVRQARTALPPVCRTSGQLTADVGASGEGTGPKPADFSGRHGLISQLGVTGPESSQPIGMGAATPLLGALPLEAVLQNAAARPLERVDDRAGGLAADAAERSFQGKGQAHVSLSESWVPHAQVTAFAWVAVRRIIPQALLGDAHNRRVLRGAVARLVSLRRFEQMSLHQATQGLKTSRVPALWRRGCSVARGAGVPASEAAAQQRLLTRWVAWLIGQLVVPLLRANFYITESECYRQQIFYYRKTVWRQVRAAALLDLQKLFTAVPASDARACLQSRALGVSKIRFLPKRAGMRPIANLGSASTAVFPGVRLRVGPRQRRRCAPVQLAFKSVNSVLESLQQVLKHEVKMQPAALGSSVMGYDDIYARYEPFLRLWRQQGTVGGEPTQAYIVTVDVSKAFDAVDVELLLQIVEPLLANPQYLVVKYAEVIPTVGAVRVAHRCTAVSSQPNFTGFPRLAKSLASATSGRVFTDKVIYSTEERTKLQALLREHLQRNLVRIGRSWHYQSRGIPQGSGLSSTLCSLYLAHLERRHLLPLLPGVEATSTGTRGSSSGASAHLADLVLQAGSSSSHSMQNKSQGGRQTREQKGLRQPPSLAMRLIDDFLFITPSGTAAQALALRLREGFPDYGISINPAKTRTNFDAIPGQGPPLLRNMYKDGAGREFVKWCGLLVNCASLEVQADYTRYCGQHLAASLSLPLHKTAGRAVAAKLRVYMRPKCHALLLDGSINSAATVRLNVYQIALLAAMKLHCAVAHLPRPPPKGCPAILAAVRAGLTYLVHLVRTRIASARQTFGVECRCCISGCHIRWLGLHAFVRVLQRKQARYGPVLAALNAEMRDPAFQLLPAQMASVVDPGKSPAFDEIRF